MTYCGNFCSLCTKTYQYNKLSDCIRQHPELEQRC